MVTVETVTVTKKGCGVPIIADAIGAMKKSSSEPSQEGAVADSKYIPKKSKVTPCTKARS